MWQGLALGLSMFNAIICLWLGMTVWLDGGRDRGPRLAALGMLMAGIFFLIHAAVVTRGTPITNIGIPLWWRVISVPSLLAPYAWYATMIWYAGVSGRALRIHKLLLIIVGLFISTIVLLLTAIYPLPPEFRSLALRIVPAWLVAGLPFLIAGYLLTLMICFILPVHALSTGQGRQTHVPLPAWARVRIWLIRTSLLGLLAGFIALAGAVAIFSEQSIQLRSQIPTNAELAGLFYQFDVSVLFVVGAALVAAGQAVGAYAAFTERPLPQWNRGDQWRWLLVIAGLFGLVIGISEACKLPSIYTILFATTMAALAYALLSWRYRVEHENFMQRLRPFVTSLHLEDRLFDGGISLSSAVTSLVEAVSRDVVRAERACLVLRDRIPGVASPITYRWGDLPTPRLAELPVGEHGSSGVQLNPADSGGTWAIPLWDSRGLAGVLVLGMPVAGVYSEELMEVAAACCARLTDALAGERAARMLAGVLRQRIAEVKVLGSQGRRTLHDDILPELHAALIHLSALPVEASTLTPAVTALSSAHSQLSRLIRTLPPASPHQLDQVGLLQSLHDIATIDFGAAFDGIEWETESEINHYLASTPQFVGEVVSYAFQEGVRNAARHARIEDQPLHLTIVIQWQNGLLIEIKDNGSGIHPNVESGAGLSVHRSLLAILGGTFQLEALSPHGTKVSLYVPEDLWSLPPQIYEITT